MMFAVPSAVFSAVAFQLRYHNPELVITYLGFGDHFRSTQIWQALNVILGLVLSFRTMTALNRYWLGNSLLHQMRMNWYNATSCLMSFTRGSAKPKEEIEEFRHLLVRLMSLLCGLSFHQIQDEGSDQFCILGLEALDTESMIYLNHCRENNINRVQVVMHWIQELVTANIDTGILPIPAPILTRVYQDLSRGLVLQHDARNLSDVPSLLDWGSLTRSLAKISRCLGVRSPVSAESGRSGI